MSDGISDMHREEERKAAELVERICCNCKRDWTVLGGCRYCDHNNSSFIPSQSAIDAKVEELRAKEEMSMHYKKDDLEIDMEAREDELKVMVEHPQNNTIVEFLINMYKTINPKSYLSVTFTYGEEYELLIQRKVGETPAEKAAALESDNAEMLELLKECYKNLIQTCSDLCEQDTNGGCGGCNGNVLKAKIDKMIEKAEGK